MGSLPCNFFRDHPDGPAMVLVEAGQFIMGGREGDPDLEADELPARLVSIDGPIAVGLFPITRGEWQRFANCGMKLGSALDAPATYVSYIKAKAYCAFLNSLTGHAYRLLSEAEWEYCARAGADTRFPWGQSAEPNSCRYGKVGASVAGVRPVDPNTRNAFGICEMLGNVWEWVEDLYHGDYQNAPTNGAAWIEGGVPKFAVLRGASWEVEARFLRPSYRHAAVTSYQGPDVGFRVARNVDE